MENMTKQQFENNLQATANKVAEMIYNKSKEMNNGVSEITKEEAFRMATDLVLKSHQELAKTI